MLLSILGCSNIHKSKYFAEVDFIVSAVIQDLVDLGQNASKHFLVRNVLSCLLIRFVSQEQLILVLVYVE